MRNMTQEEKTKIEERIVDVLKTVYDPEIPVNIYDLGMIYKIDLNDDGTLNVDAARTDASGDHKYPFNVEGYQYV